VVHPAGSGGLVDRDDPPAVGQATFEVALGDRFGTRAVADLPERAQAAEEDVVDVQVAQRGPRARFRAFSN
jgi:hypothetical protein